jgi:hypothetical protein
MAENKPIWTARDFDGVLWRNHQAVYREMDMWRLLHKDGCSDIVVAAVEADAPGWRWLRRKAVADNNIKAEHFGRLAREAKSRQAQGLFPRPAYVVRGLRISPGTNPTGLLSACSPVAEALVEAGVPCDLSQPPPPGLFYAVAVIVAGKTIAAAVRLLPAQRAPRGPVAFLPN